MTLHFLLILGFFLVFFGVVCSFFDDDENMFCRQSSAIRRLGLSHLRTVTAAPIHSKAGPRFNQIGVVFNQKPLHHNQNESSQSKLSRFLPLISPSSAAANSAITSASQRASFFNRGSSDRSAGGLFGLKELHTHEGLFELKDRAERRVNELMDEAFDVQAPSDRKPVRRKLVQIFDDISNELCRVADLAEFVRSTHPNEKYRLAADETFGYISQIVEKLNTNHKLYARLKSETENNDPSNPPLDECDKRVSRLYLLDFEQSGIHLPEQVRDQFVEVNNELINLLMKFQVNSQTPVTVHANELDPKFSRL